MTGRMGRAGTWGPSGTRERTSAALWAKPHRWNRLAADGLLPDGTENRDGHRPRVFCASLADVFEPRPELATWRRDLFEDVIAKTPHLDWLVLTKRPDVAAEWLHGWYDEQIDGMALGGMFPFEENATWHRRNDFGWGVLPNLWIGTSIESTAYTWRADWLRRIPAPVRFISAEPLLGSLFESPVPAADVSGVGGHGSDDARNRTAAAGTDDSEAPSAGPGDDLGVARRLASAASGAEEEGRTDGLPPRGANLGEVTGENRTRPDAAGDTDGVHSPGASGPGSIPGLSMSSSGSDPTRIPGSCAANGADGRALTSEDHAQAATEKLPATPTPSAGLAGGDGSARAGVQSGAGGARPLAPLDLTGIDWIIVGGESGGRNARPMHPDWAREIRDAVLAEPCGRCAAGVATDVFHTARPALHFKQWGSWMPGGSADGHFILLDRSGRRGELADGVENFTQMHYAGANPKSGGKLVDGVEWCEFPDSAPVPA